MRDCGVHQVVGAVLPFALVVTVSPVNIVAAILLLFSERRILAASAYLVGFAVGVAAVLVALELLAAEVDLSAGSDGSHAAAVVRIVLGGAFLLAATRKVRARRHDAGGGELPGWMDGITSFGPGKAAATGVGIGAGNPKNVAMAVAASLAIGAAGLPAAQVAGVIALYVVIASLGVAAPLVVAVGLGDRSEPVLTSWRDWLGRNNDVVMAVLYFVFAAVLVGNGIASL